MNVVIAILSTLLYRVNGMVENSSMYELDLLKIKRSNGFEIKISFRRLKMKWRGRRIRGRGREESTRETKGRCRPISGKAVYVKSGRHEEI